MPEPRGISIHIGLNRVDPAHYRDEQGQPWSGELAGCENDAHDMDQIATARGFSSRLLLNQAATADAVKAALVEATTTLRSGDILLVTYSGHGGQVPDTQGDEADGYDETWCLFDRELLDDELYELWGRFAEGVRILVFSDSCHSGSVSRAPRIDTASRPAGVRARMMPRRAAERTYEAHKDAYDQVQMRTPLGDDQPVKATVVLLSGCQDDQLSSDGDGNGLFTATLKKVWGDGQFDKSLKEFRDVIAGRMPPWQVPNYFVVGAANAGFESQPPFTV